MVTGHYYENVIIARDTQGGFTIFWSHSYVRKITSFMKYN